MQTTSVRPAIHATLSAFVGCTANRTAAAAAAQLEPIQRRRTTNDSPATHAWSSVFEIWNISGEPPPSCQSTA